jgi:hypothetical protein
MPSKLTNQEKEKAKKVAYEVTKMVAFLKRNKIIKWQHEIAEAIGRDPSAISKAMTHTEDNLLTAEKIRDEILYYYNLTISDGVVLLNQNAEQKSNIDRNGGLKIDRLLKVDNGKGRMEKIEGKWSGFFWGCNELNKGERVMDLTLKLNSTEITGEVLIEVFGVSQKLNLKGSFRNDRFLILNYDNLQVVQFGTMILELKSTNDKLVGNLVGFGYLSESIITGELSFQKVVCN